MDYMTLESQLQVLLPRFAQFKCMALAVENSPAWVLADLAAMACQIPCVPLPFFFSGAQQVHAMRDAGAQTLLTDRPQFFADLLGDKVIAQHALVIAGQTLHFFQLDFAPVSLPLGTAKITYTSGTTGNPKGVCLSESAMLAVAKSICAAAELSSIDKHLCVLPLATLLENVAGVYATLLAGGTAHVLAAEEVGLSGAKLDGQRLLETLDATQASTAIFTPELLSALVGLLETGERRLQHLRFLAVGGASVAPGLLHRAAAVGLPVFEGYGLSECSSVVALNTAQAKRIGSVGKPLPHVTIRLADDGEIYVAGNAFLGYAGQMGYNDLQELATGDVGYLDDAGFLHISGRKKNIFITSFGRNVSPEWVERELNVQPSIFKSALFGEARPCNVAIIVPKAGASQASIDAEIQAVNQKLPDYARVGEWIFADGPFSPQNGQMTPNGRLKRDAIWQYYQDRINQLYEGK
ncbi:MAG TPA: AMP-binding protein [Methylophilus sp.]|nr:AMP-binding protein [Methylophilus sp.]HQQ33010.1 AMP-binding protein [Methylophilus sp.]